MSYVFNRESYANTLALHYYDASGIDNKSLFYHLENWLLEHGFEPTKTGGKGKSNISYDRGKKSHEKEKFSRLHKGNLWIGCLPPDDQIRTEAFDYKASIHIRNSYEDPRRNRFVISWDDTLLAWDSQIFVKLVQDLSAFFKPEYGYAFQRQFKYGPGIYPGSIIFGIPNKIEYDEICAEITRWGTIGIGTHSMYRPHFIRDVYPLNFLSRRHLEAAIGSQTLEQWILSDLTHGQLERVTDDLTAWSVNPEHIPALREALKPHNILICFMAY